MSAKTKKILLGVLAAVLISLAAQLPQFQAILTSVADYVSHIDVSDPPPPPALPAAGSASDEDAGI
jgi:hypothetical protein